jgi:hypothetical protein
VTAEREEESLQEKLKALRTAQRRIDQEISQRSERFSELSFRHVRTSTSHGSISEADATIAHPSPRHTAHAYEPVLSYGSVSNAQSHRQQSEDEVVEMTQRQSSSTSTGRQRSFHTSRTKQAPRTQGLTDPSDPVSERTHVSLETPGVVADRLTEIQTAPPTNSWQGMWGERRDDEITVDHAERMERLANLDCQASERVGRVFGPNREALHQWRNNDARASNQSGGQPSEPYSFGLNEIKTITNPVFSNTSMLRFYDYDVMTADL